MSDSLRPCGAAHKAPLSMGFCRQEYWSGYPLPSPGDLLKLASPELAGRFFTAELLDYGCVFRLLKDRYQAYLSVLDIHFS